MEIILAILIIFGDAPTELYEYPMPSMEKCVHMLENSKVNERTSAFCVSKPKQAAVTEPDVL